MQLKKTATAFVSIVFAITVAIGGVLMAQTTQPQTAPKKGGDQPQRSAGAAVTDTWITMKVHSQFVPEDALEDSNIDVDTRNGVVTLSGTVATEAGRTRAVAIAKATDGVKSVNDTLKVAPPADRPAGAAAPGAAKTGARRVTDGWIKSKIYAQFLTENTLEDSDIDVDVSAGNVTLNGTVATDAGRTRAVSIAKATDGVKNVKDALKIAKR